MDDKDVRRHHRILMDNRKSCLISNVNDVISFDMNMVMLETDYGLINIKGKDLHVNRLSVEKGEVDVDGTIDSIIYSDVNTFKKKGEGFVSRIFR
ncbi:MAG: sporulation protein YabP [Lachnospiraceae bacterium]|nr:sporulation protein YabP [Lachnospira sp.]MBR6696734.1 sporulation protein YabP [Lachnospiraceae bacterium]